MATIEEIMAGLDPTTRKRLSTAFGIEAKRMPTPSLGLTLALNGGLGFGRQVLVWGNKSAGKSLWSQRLVAMAQQMGLTCAWFDVENSWEDPWASRLGVDGKNLMYSPTKTVNGVAEEVGKLMTAGTDIIVVDSISALLPGAFFDKGGELDQVDNSKQIGSLSRDLGIAIQGWNYLNKNTLLILLSQIRNNFGAQHASHIPTGGFSTTFYSSTIIKLTSSQAEADQIKGTLYRGDMAYEDKIGRPVNWNIQWNKLGPQNRSGQYDMYYDGPFVGIDKASEILDYADKYGVIERTKQGYYTIFDEKIHGKKAALSYLAENPAVLDTIEGELLVRV